MEASNTSQISGRLQGKSEKFADAKVSEDEEVPLLVSKKGAGQPLQRIRPWH
jgi:hypothetical protein